MGMYDFWWNSHQAVQIDELKQENQRLRTDIDQLTVIFNAWIEHFNEKIKRLENERTNWKTFETVRGPGSAL